MRIPKPIAIKKRHILGISKTEYNHRENANEHFHVQSYTGETAITLPHIRALAAVMSESVVRRRLATPRCMAHVALTNDSGEFVGYRWSVIAGPEGLWHDNIYVPEGTALFFNGFVKPEYRRRGISTLLQAAVCNSVFSTASCHRGIVVVEAQNIASFRSWTKFGLKPVATNYLIKLFGRNVYSVVKEEGHRRVDFVLWGPKGNRL